MITQSVTGVLTLEQEKAGIYVEQEDDRYIVRYTTTCLDIAVSLRTLYAFSPVTPAMLQETAQRILDEITEKRFEPGNMYRCEKCDFQFNWPWSLGEQSGYEPSCLLYLQLDAADRLGDFRCMKEVG